MHFGISENGAHQKWAHSMINVEQLASQVSQVSKTHNGAQHANHFFFLLSSGALCLVNLQIVVQKILFIFH